MSESYTYLDHAATTPVRPEVRDAMLPYLGARFGNPSSAHREGRASRAGLEQARRQVAEALGVEPVEVYFTSGGTEADNLAVIGAALGARAAGARMLVAVAATEHKAVLAASHAVSQQGGEERVIPVHPDGLLDLEALDRVLRERPALVSVMWVNNETSVIQPIPEIALRVQAQGSLFHSDLVQAVGKVPFSLRDPVVPLATISGHKLGAPKGIGALIARRGARIEPLLHGGGQQSGVRPGTENILGAVGLGCAVALAVAEQGAEGTRLSRLRGMLLEGLRAHAPDLEVTGESAPRAPHVLNLRIPGIRADVLLTRLDLAGIGASGGSACTTGAIEPSHVLTAMGVAREAAIGAVRFSLGHSSTENDVSRAVALFPSALAAARKLAEALVHG